MMMAIGKLVSIIILSLVFANLLVSLIEPVVEVVIPEDRRKVSCLWLSLSSSC